MKMHLLSALISKISNCILVGSEKRDILITWYQLVYIFIHITEASEDCSCKPRNLNNYLSLVCHASHSNLKIATDSATRPATHPATNSTTVLHHSMLSHIRSCAFQSLVHRN